MLAVSNTSPLRHLIPVGQADVAAELSDSGSPLAVRQWIAQRPSWLQIHPLNSPPDAELMEALDRGEREAIQLAKEQKADVLSMAEWKGRAIVLGRSRPLIGALGILGEAYHQGLIDDPRYVLAECANKDFALAINWPPVSRFSSAPGMPDEILCPAP